MLRLMLADDDLGERDYLENIIKNGYAAFIEVVCKAANGIEFMEMLEECNPDIVLLDIKMPQMDGLETAKKVREKYPDIQIVIISAYNDFAYAKQAMKLGISEYLLKPYLDSELCEVMDRVIARIRKREDILLMLSSGAEQERLYRKIDKKYLWNTFLKTISIEDTQKVLQAQGFEEKWVKVILISSAALTIMGDFSQEVLENHLRKNDIKVLSSIWMNQMVICLLAEQKESFADVNSGICRIKNYLTEEQLIPVACGVSAAYQGMESLVEAYEEAAIFIKDFSESKVSSEFQKGINNIRELSVIENEIEELLILEKGKECLKKMEELIDILEIGLEYEEIAVKLNFRRSWQTIMYSINRSPGLQITEEVMKTQIEKIEQLNFNGEHLKYHLDYFTKIHIKKM